MEEKTIFTFQAPNPQFVRRHHPVPSQTDPTLFPSKNFPQSQTSKGANNILIITKLMKRSLLLKQNKSVLNLKPQTLNPPLPKDSKLFLPPINPIPTPDMQKTLAFLMRKMEAFTSQYPGAVADLLNKCLEAVNSHLAQGTPMQDYLAKSIVISTHQKTEPGNEEWGVRSQMMSVKRTDLQKVESRKLFEKMKAAKHEERPAGQDQETLAASKSRLAEMEQACSTLSMKLQQCRSNLQERESDLSACKNNLAASESACSMLKKDNSDLMERLEKAERENDSQKNTILELQGRWKRTGQQLVCRQQQLKALWQAQLSSKACIL